MPVNANNYNHRGGGNYGIVLCCPTIVADDHLVYFDYNRRRGSWVIRDFIASRRLAQRALHPTVPDIEADAIFDEFPAWCNAEENPGDWRTYLILRTTAVLQRGGRLSEISTPTSAFEAWQPLEI